MKLKLISIFICLVVVVYTFDYLTTVSLIVCQIQKEGSISPCSKELEEVISEKKGSSLLDITKNNLTISSQDVSLIKIEKQIPQKLILTFTPKQARYLLSNQETVFMDGSISPNFTVENLPKVAIPMLGDDNLYEFMPKQYHTAILKIIDEFQTTHIKVDQIVWEDENSIVVYTELPQKILVNPKNLSSLHQVVSGILQHSTYQSEKEIITEIDLRYSHIILR